MGTHGVKVKVSDHGRAQWLTSKGGLTGKRIHAALTSPERAQDYATDLVESNPGVVEWARPERIMAD